MRCLWPLTGDIWVSVRVDEQCTPLQLVTLFPGLRHSRLERGAGVTAIIHSNDGERLFWEAGS